MNCYGEHLESIAGMPDYYTGEEWDELFADEFDLAYDEYKSYILSTI